MWGFTMDTSVEQRASQRIPIKERVQVRVRGRMASYALAINISAGGLLLSAAPSLPVGTPCELTIPYADSLTGRGIQATGTVVRSDEGGTAIQFEKKLDPNVYNKFADRAQASNRSPLLDSYLTYFKVSQSANHADCERLLGVNRKTFNRVCLTTFCTCIPLAVLPVWAFQDSIPAVPTWVKVSASFGYGAIWMGIIQPSIDLMVFKFIGNKTNA